MCYQKRITCSPYPCKSKPVCKCGQTMLLLSSACLVAQTNEALIPYDHFLKLELSTERPIGIEFRPDPLRVACTSLGLRLALVQC